jgi:DNA-binding YbaB/EbfC family protein
MMKQAQEFQKNMTKIQQEIEELTVESSVGGGAVKASVSGKMEIESITISPEVIESGDVEMIQDLIVAAANEGLSKAKEIASEKMGGLTGGMKIPGLM